MCDKSKLDKGMVCDGKGRAATIVGYQEEWISCPCTWDHIEEADVQDELARREEMEDKDFQNKLREYRK